MSIKLIKFIPAIIWFAISLWLFTLPGPTIPKVDWMDKLQVDKIVHATLFFVLCFLCMFPFKKTGIDTKTRLPWFILITVSAIFYGIIIEFVQRDFILNRSFDVWDITADSAGSLIAFFRCKNKLAVI